MILKARRKLPLIADTNKLHSSLYLKYYSNSAYMHNIVPFTFDKFDFIKVVVLRNPNYINCVYIYYVFNARSDSEAFPERSFGYGEFVIVNKLPNFHISETLFRAANSNKYFKKGLPYWNLPEYPLS